MVENVTTMDNSVYMTNEATGGAHYFSSQPDVVEQFEARGWKVTEPPTDTPFLPPAGDGVATNDFILLYHPVVKSTHEFPANAEAIEGALEAGWELMKKNKPDPEPTPEPVPEDSKPKKSAKTQAAKEEKGVTDNG
jgi:hypothetical protein